MNRLIIYPIAVNIHTVWCMKMQRKSNKCLAVLYLLTKVQFLVEGGEKIYKLTVDDVLHEVLGKLITFELRRWDVVVLGWVVSEIIVGNIDRLIETVLAMVDFESEHDRLVVIFRNPILMLLGGYLFIHLRTPLQ